MFEPVSCLSSVKAKHAKGLWKSLDESCSKLGNEMMRVYTYPLTFTDTL